MHPPPFRLAHRLSDWPECQLELHCCKGMTLYPVRLMIEQRGDVSFGELLPCLRCKNAKGHPRRSISAPGIAT
jgi:hypothetical protein